jgi:(S)-ureidoglycine aminohydrolase
MTPLFGLTRTTVARNYALIEPASFVGSSLPDWKGGAKPSVVISPVMGARFTQTHVRFEAEGEGKGDTGALEFCGFVTRGSVAAMVDGEQTTLGAGGFLYVPPETAWEIRGGAGAELVVFTKRYERLEGVDVPSPLFGDSAKVEGQAFMGDPDARLQVLLPERPGFDMAVNVFTYQPGATLPMVETHIMEHGLVMLSGQGVYRLHDDWHPVCEGDVIWMGSYCPQWFVAMGKQPASYLYYKDVNRPAL